MSTDTTPPVGTIMRWHDLQAEVLLASPEYMVARDTGAWLRAMRHVDGKWRDHDGDVWEIEVLKGGDGPTPRQRPPIPDRDPETFPPRARVRREVAISAWIDRLTALEAVVEDMNRRLRDAEDEIDVLEPAQPDPAQASDLPTLPVGTVLTHGVDTRTVVGAAPGFVLVLDRFDKRSALAWIDKGWRRASAGRAWTVRP